MTNVLLAEDDAAIAEPLARALTREGYGCEVVSTGADALEKALDSRYELLILDLGLPVLDGLEVCRRVRAQRPALAVLMLTARTDEVDFVVGLDAGADDYVGKPFRLAELLAYCGAASPATVTRCSRAARSGWMPGHAAFSPTDRTSPWRTANSTFCDS